MSVFHCGEFLTCLSIFTIRIVFGCNYQKGNVSVVAVVAVVRAVDLATNIYKKVGVGEFCENSPHHFCHAHDCTTDNCVKGTTAVYHPCYANIGHVLSPPLSFLLPCVLTLPRVLPSTSHDLIRQTGCDTTRSTVFSTFFFSSLTSERDLFNM